MVLDVSDATRRVRRSADVFASLQYGQGQSGFCRRDRNCPARYHDGPEAGPLWPDKKSENQSHSRSIANRERSGRNLPGRGGGGLTMRLIDLTMPIWEGAGYGEILPFTNSSVRLLEYMFYDQHGLRMTRMKLDGEMGSPVMVPQQRNPFDHTPLQPNLKTSWTLDEIPHEKLILRDIANLDVRAEEGHEIVPAEMETAIKRADYRKGDEVLVRTGWGTRQRAYELGVDYYKRTPSIHYDAAALLAAKMDG